MALKTERVVYGGREYLRTWSDDYTAVDTPMTSIAGTDGMTAKQQARVVQDEKDATARGQK